MINMLCQIIRIKAKKIPSNISVRTLYKNFRNSSGILSKNRNNFCMKAKIILYNHQVVALRMNQSDAFKFLYKNFQPKFINFDSNC